MSGKSTLSSLGSRKSSGQKIVAPKQNITHELAKQGIEYLREGDYESAQKVFSAAEKMSPSNSTAHLLNGISYHLQYLNNAADNSGLIQGVKM